MKKEICVNIYIKFGCKGLLYNISELKIKLSHNYFIKYLKRYSLTCRYVCKMYVYENTKFRNAIDNKMNQLE